MTEGGERDKVRLGFFSFTEVTDPDAHRSYNEWHQLDHMPEQFPLPGIVYGQRWVSTPACRAARAVSDDRLDPIHYVTLYLLAPPIERTLCDFMDLGAELRAAGRFHRQRRAHVSGPLFVQHMLAAPRVLVSARAVPYRPNRGVYVVVDELAGGAAPAIPDSWCTGHLPALVATPGVAGVWTFATSTTIQPYQWTTAPYRITVCFLDDDPLLVAPAVAAVDAARRANDPARTIFSGPFETITPWQWDWFEH
jgi:hypothetical protein